jgi:hypothetical protein
MHSLLTLIIQANIVNCCHLLGMKLILTMWSMIEMVNSEMNMDITTVAVTVEMYSVPKKFETGFKLKLIFNNCKYEFIL